MVMARCRSRAGVLEDLFQSGFFSGVNCGYNAPGIRQSLGVYKKASCCTGKTGTMNLS